MPDVAIAPYASQGIDAGDELRALGLDEAAYYLRHLQKVATRRGSRPYWKGQAFHGRSVLKKSHGPTFIVYVVEQERDGSVRVTLMLAALAAGFPTPAALTAVLNPRLKDYFR